jgi:hypothetical protein
MRAAPMLMERSDHERIMPPPQEQNRDQFETTSPNPVNPWALPYRPTPCTRSLAGIHNVGAVATSGHVLSWAQRLLVCSEAKATVTMP